MGALTGLHVVITRPAHQAGAIIERLRHAGAVPIAFPTIAIAPPVDTETARARLQSITTYDLLIFISANAVEQALALLDESQRAALTQARVGAIGSKTAAALAKYHVPVSLVPQQGFTSEDFLALNAVQDCHDQRVLIIRGEGGRETLATTLRARGAAVDYADVYCRVIPPNDPQLLKQQHQKQQLDIIAVTSSESVQNLLMLLDDSAWVKAVPLLAGSDRIAESARGCGFRYVLTAANPSDAAMLDALQYVYLAKGQPKDNKTDD